MTRDAPGYATRRSAEGMEFAAGLSAGDTTSWAEVFRSEGCWNG